MLNDETSIELALRRVGELLAAAGEQFTIIIMGGAALNLLGVISRPTSDVDVLGVVPGDAAGPPYSIDEAPRPWPDPLQRAVQDVARDMRLDTDWLNTRFQLGWRRDLPPGLMDRLEWRTYGALRVGLLSRRDLIYFKVLAAADRDPVSSGTGGRPSKDARDLIALSPDEEELTAAAAWARAQDAGPEFASLVDNVIRHVRAAIR